MYMENHWNLTMKQNTFGVTIDNKLTWRQYIENIKNRINKGIEILKRMRHF